MVNWHNVQEVTWLTHKSFVVPLMASLEPQINMKWIYSTGTTTALWENPRTHKLHTERLPMVKLKVNELPLFLHLLLDINCLTWASFCVFFSHFIIHLIWSGWQVSLAIFVVVFLLVLHNLSSDILPPYQLLLKCVVGIVFSWTI